MNQLAQVHLESEDRLFQTLHTTIKKWNFHCFCDWKAHWTRINLSPYQTGIALDTIGFITNLPHELGLIVRFLKFLVIFHSRVIQNDLRRGPGRGCCPACERHLAPSHWRPEESCAWCTKGNQPWRDFLLEKNGIAHISLSWFQSIM